MSFKSGHSFWSTIVTTALKYMTSYFEVCAISVLVSVDRLVLSLVRCCHFLGFWYVLLNYIVGVLNIMWFWVLFKSYGKCCFFQSKNWPSWVGPEFLPTFCRLCFQCLFSFQRLCSAIWSVPCIHRRVTRLGLSTGLLFRSVSKDCGILFRAKSPTWNSGKSPRVHAKPDGINFLSLLLSAIILTLFWF